MTIPRIVGTDFGGPRGRGPAAARAVARHIGRRPVGRGRPNALPSTSASWAGTCPGTAAARRRRDRSASPSWPQACSRWPTTSPPDRPSHYAGDSVGGAVGLQLLLDAPDRVTSAALLCTGAVIGDPEQWRVRAATVRAIGYRRRWSTASAERWFAAGFADREPGRPPPCWTPCATPTPSRTRRPARPRRLRRHRPAAGDHHAGAGDRGRRGHPDATGSRCAADRLRRARTDASSCSTASATSRLRRPPSASPS